MSHYLNFRTKVIFVGRRLALARSRSQERVCHTGRCAPATSLGVAAEETGWNGRFQRQTEGANRVAYCPPIGP
jgi:hypothetical protein